MTIIGGNLEKKEIGLPIAISGTHMNTEIDTITGSLRLVEIDKDGEGNPIYEDEGTWTSDVINLGDNFQDFEKIFTTHTNNTSSSFAVLTRVSDNGSTWSDWTPIAMDGTIQSDTKQYIQVKIDLFAGFISDVITIAKGDFGNGFIEEKEHTKGVYITPTLTSNTSSVEGFSFAETVNATTYDAWKAFDKTTGVYLSKSSINTGILGFYFYKPKQITKYSITSPTSSTYITGTPNTWILQGSTNTTNGIDGTWENLDTQSGQVFDVVNKKIEYEFKNTIKYNAYRLNVSKNNGLTNFLAIGELDFFEQGTTIMQLKRDYQYDMTPDSTWIDEGTLFREKINREDWLRIDRLAVIDNGN